MQSQHKEALAYGNEPQEFGRRHHIMGKIQDHPEEPEVCGRDIGYGWSISNDSIGILDTCKGLSVNDSYWLDDGHEDLSFDDVNLFDNDLDEALSIVAYTGYSSGIKHKLGLSTEWTTNGQYPKAWRRIDDKLVLYKQGLPGS